MVQRSGRTTEIVSCEVSNARQSPFSFTLLGSFGLWKNRVGGQLEVIWKKLSGDEFRENGMSLESPVKKIGILFEAGRKWGKQACSVETVL